MSEKIAKTSSNTTDFKNPSLTWIIGFLFIVSFVMQFCSSQRTQGVRQNASERFFSQNKTSSSQSQFFLHSFGRGILRIVFSDIQVQSKMNFRESSSCGGVLEIKYVCSVVYVYKTTSSTSCFSFISFIVFSFISFMFHGYIKPFTCTFLIRSNTIS